MLNEDGKRMREICRIDKKYKFYSNATESEENILLKFKRTNTQRKR